MIKRLTARQLRVLVKQKHRAIIGAQLGLLLIFAIFISMQYRSLEQLQGKVADYQQSLGQISTMHRAQWRASTDATFHALGMPDAYLEGVEKVDEVYEAVMAASEEAVRQKDLIIEELKKYGIVPPPEEPTPAT